MSTIALFGKTCTGKTVLSKVLEGRGYKRKIVYTTRPMRPGEIDGIDYFFVSQEKFDDMVKNGEFAEFVTYHASFGACSYGSTKESYKSDEKSVIVLNPYGLKMVKDAGIKVTSVLLDLPDDILVERLHRRGDSKEEIKRRLLADKKDFANARNLADIRPDVVDRTPDEIADEIESIMGQLRNLRCKNCQ